MTAVFDYLRMDRIGLPESVFCDGKELDALNALLEELVQNAKHPILFTRLEPEKFDRLDSKFSKHLDYDVVSRTAYLHDIFPERIDGSVSIITGGTSDVPVAKEASRTLAYMGVRNELYADIGVAGLWRLQERFEEIADRDVIIAVAGMDAALASVIGGLTSKPVIAVPTSVGYGVATGGNTALNSMLASCASGLLVTNIDNGYGAACAACRIINNKYPSDGG